MSSPIHCEMLTKRFRGVSALDNLRLDVPAGSIYALIGPNGAGKTTLIKMLVNILRPTSGVCTILGTDTRKLMPSHFEQIGYVSENQQLPGWMTVEYWFSYLSSFYPSWDRQLAAELWRDLDLPPERRLDHLSRGMKMKAALASSLAYRPSLIILDEPFSGLDPLVRDELIGTMLERSENTTVFVSSHDLGEVESFASHVGFLNGGKLQSSEETASLTARFREIEVTLPGKPDLPPVWPKTWLKPEASDSLVRFTESNYDAEQTPAEISRCFPEAIGVSINPMSLRDIFVVMASSGKGRK